MRALLAAVLTLWLPACAGPPSVSSAPGGLHASGGYLHGITGLVMPERVGPFERRSVMRHDPEGFSVSARYESLDPRAALVFHHYPSGTPEGFATLEDLQAQFETAKREGFHDAWRSRLVHQQRIDFVINGVKVPGAHAVFRYPASRQRAEPIESHLWLFAAGPWYMKFRVTSPQEEASAAFEAQKRFIRSFEWLQPP